MNREEKFESVKHTALDPESLISIATLKTCDDAESILEEIKLIKEKYTKKANNIEPDTIVVSMLVEAFWIRTKPQDKKLNGMEVECNLAFPDDKIMLMNRNTADPFLFKFWTGGLDSVADKIRKAMSEGEHYE
ncbi:MAG: hypothetical protein GY797_27115 [Deltaproteobacteria bacterium]|nr:hypothetical protein [Deltaproteobacteria bacterium]